MSNTVYFKNIKKELLKEIISTKFKINIAVAWITDPDIIDSLEVLLKRNVKVKILSYDDKINNTDLIKKLYYLGADVKLSSGLMHNKFCIIDDSKVISGSYNWTINASRNDENITIIKNDLNLISNYNEEFTKLWFKYQNIDNKLKVNKFYLKDVELEFNNLINELKKYSLPFFYNVKNEKTGRDYYHNKYGSLESGYYLIKSKEQLISDFKYIFYIERGVDIRELKKINGITLEFNLDRFSSIFPFNNDKTIIEIKKNIYGIKAYNKSVLSGYIFNFDELGNIKDKFKLTYKLTNQKLLIVFENKHLILNEDGEFYDFQNAFRDEKGSCVDSLGIKKLINDQIFCIDVLIDFERNLKLYALYDLEGTSITRPIFKNSTYESLNGESSFIFKEYPVAFSTNTHVKNTSSIIFPLWVHKDITLEFKKNLNKYKPVINYSKTIVQGENIPNRINVGINTNSLFFFISDNSTGLFSLAMYTMNMDFKIPDYNMAIKEYLDMSKFVLLDNEKINIAKTIINKYQQLYLKENIEKENEKKKIIEDDRCFIASCVYGDKNHAATMEFREFRDKFLLSFDIGKKIVELYYKKSPFFVTTIKKKPLLLKLTKIILELVRILIVRKYLNINKRVLR